MFAQGRSTVIEDALTALIQLAGVEIEVRADASRLKVVDVPVHYGSTAKLARLLGPLDNEAAPLLAQRYSSRRDGAPMRTLTVISPVYNEAEVIEHFYQVLSKELQGLADRYASRILFVVDRSSDDTLDILKRIAAADHSVGILALSSRFGHQMSLLAGIDHADSRCRSS